MNLSWGIESQRRPPEVWLCVRWGVHKNRWSQKSGRWLPPEWSDEYGEWPREEDCTRGRVGKSRHCSLPVRGSLFRPIRCFQTLQALIQSQLSVVWRPLSVCENSYTTSFVFDFSLSSSSWPPTEVPLLDLTTIAINLLRNRFPQSTEIL